MESGTKELGFKVSSKGNLSTNNWNSIKIARFRESKNTSFMKIPTKVTDD